AVLAQGGVLVVFPEGTRDSGAVRPVRGTHEIESAIAVAEDGFRPVIVPTAFNYGKNRFFRRRLDVAIGAPLAVAGSTAQLLASRTETALRDAWRPAPA